MVGSGAASSALASDDSPSSPVIWNSFAHAWTPAQAAVAASQTSAGRQRERRYSMVRSSGCRLTSGVTVAVVRTTWTQPTNSHHSGAVDIAGGVVHTTERLPCVYRQGVQNTSGAVARTPRYDYKGDGCRRSTAADIHSAVRWVISRAGNLHQVVSGISSWGSTSTGGTSTCTLTKHTHFARRY